MTGSLLIRACRRSSRARLAAESSGGIKRMASGIHHFTGITGDVQANIDFYVGFLGLKLVPGA